MLHVVKRDGRLTEFNSIKITNAIKKASIEIGYELKESEIFQLTQRVIENIEDINTEKISVEEIQNMVEKVLLENQFMEVGLAYSNYRKERTKIREIKSELMSAIEKIGVETDRDNGVTSYC
ncbi:hypothetical protein EQM05_00745 [Clostridium sp. JN-9]|nr:hypothetical protein EQM05_00745 [Clostridium sp. JN-9]